MKHHILTRSIRSLLLAPLLLGSIATYTDAFRAITLEDNARDLCTR